MEIDFAQSIPEIVPMRFITGGELDNLIIVYLKMDLFGESNKRVKRDIVVLPLEVDASLED